MTTNLCQIVNLGAKTFKTGEAEKYPLLQLNIFEGSNTTLYSILPYSETNVHINPHSNMLSIFLQSRDIKAPTTLVRVLNHREKISVPSPKSEGIYELIGATFVDINYIQKTIGSSFGGSQEYKVGNNTEAFRQFYEQLITHHNYKEPELDHKKTEIIIPKRGL